MGYRPYAIGNRPPSSASKADMSKHPALCPTAVWAGQFLGMWLLTCHLLLTFGRYKDDTDSPTEDGEKPRVLYSLEFTFDADARVAITIYCQAVEEFVNGMAV